MYAIKNKWTGEYLNYASKRKKILGKGETNYEVFSPFPTLRPKEHIEKHFKKWIAATATPEAYKIVKFKEIV